MFRVSKVVQVTRITIINYQEDEIQVCQQEQQGVDQVMVWG